MAKTVFYLTPSVAMLGARISLVELLIHIDRNRYKPIVICPREGPLCDRLREIDIDIRIIRFGSWRKVKHWPLIPNAIRQLINAAQSEKVQLWHSNEFWSFPYVYRAAKRLNTPTICHFRCSRNPQQLPPRKLHNYYVPKADRIIALSKAQKRLFEKIPEVNSKFLVIPNGVDTERFLNHDGAAFRRELSINGDDFLIGMVGPVSEHKGVEEFLSACSVLTNRIPNLKAIIVGPDRHKNFTEKMRSLSMRLNIANRVLFTGFRQDIPNIMAGLDLLITPSREEAFGRVLLEAMAVGTPIIASHVGGIPEIISSPELGILVESQNVEQITDAVHNLFLHPELRRKISEKTREHVRKEYSITLHAKRIQNVYDELLG
ncbi:glycosyltransferase family 4 protein [bacterium]|nr:glycosyltransferase family 4 protein [candidate division CSSED10-310 bacterium]